MSRTIHAIFADKLMALSARQGSIAEVCRQTSINRQQFNKYLAGSSLPSKQVIAKLADFFKVEESEFFCTSSNSKDQSADFGEFCSILSGSSIECSMEQGVYLTYSRWVPSPDHILITAIVIEKKGEHTYFSRQYSFEGDPSPLGDRQPRWLDGIVLQDQGYVSMIGRLRGIDLPGYLTINLNLENRANKNLWSAVASMVLPNGVPNANSIILERTPGLSIEQAGAAIGVHPASHGLIPEDAKSIFAAFLTQPTHATFAVNFQNKWDG